MGQLSGSGHLPFSRKAVHGNILPRSVGSETIMRAIEFWKYLDLVRLGKNPSSLGKEREMRQISSGWRLALIVGLLLLQAGCLSTPINKLTEPRNSTEAQVFLKPAFLSHQRTKLAIYPFSHPQYAPGTGNVVTREFYQELLRSGLYRQVAMSNQIPGDPKNILISTELKDYDSVMRGKIVHLLAGSGNTPSQLTVEIQIMTVNSGALVWFVRLDANSETGEDIDLVWHTYPGQGVQPYQALARALAQELVKVMTPPPEPETQSVPVKSPLSKDRTID